MGSHSAKISEGMLDLVYTAFIVAGGRGSFREICKANPDIRSQNLYKIMHALEDRG